MGSRLNRVLLGYLFAFGGAAFFGVGGVFAKRAFALGVLPSTLAEWRVLFGFVVFLAIMLAFRRHDLAIRRADVPLIALFGLFGILGVQLAYYEAIQRLPLGVALVIEYTAPLLILAYQRARGRRVGTRLWLAAVLTLAGCYFVVGAYDSELRELNALGAAIAALDAVIFAVYFLVAERLVVRYSTWALLTWGFGAALLAWTVARPLWTMPWSSLTPEIALLVLGVIVVATVIPYLFTIAAVRLIPATRVGLTATSEPVIGAVAAWLLIGESLALPQLLGGIVVIGGILVAQSVRLTPEGV